MQSKAKLTGFLLEVIYFYYFLIVPFLLLTLGRTCKCIPPPWYKWVWWMDPQVVQVGGGTSGWWYKWVVVQVGGGAAGGPVTSPKMAAILDFAKN